MTRALLIGGAVLGLACAGNFDADSRGPVGEGVPPGTPTFSRQISRLMQLHCVACHRPDGHAPNPFVTYEETMPYADAIRTAVMSGVMPDGASLRVDTGCTDETMYKGPRLLTQEEIETFVKWADAGAPRGVPSEMPAPLTFPEGDEWQIGEPDKVVPNDAVGFSVPPQLGRDIFRRFAIPTSYVTDRYITAFEARPGAMGGWVVHHVSLFIDETDASLLEQEAYQANPEIPGPGYESLEARAPGALVGMWNPGSPPLTLPEGIGVKLASGATLVIEVHYSTFHTQPVIDQTMVALTFAPSNLTLRERRSFSVRNDLFSVPAGDVAYEVTATATLEGSTRLYSVTPHMHRLGTDFLVEIRYPATAEDVCMGDFGWNFDHQNSYDVTEPLLLPAGTTVNVTCRFDNSAQNPSQFNEPPTTIVAGRSSYEEMCQLVMGVVDE